MKIETPAAYSFLFNDDLYLLEKDKIAPVVLVAPVEETPVVDFNYLGGNKKNFLIIVYYAHHKVMEETHFTALENILKRKGLNLEDVAIFNRFHFESATLTQLTDYFKPAKLLVMGNKALAADLPSLILNKPAPVKDVQVLYSFSFDEMMGSNEHKRIFWDQVKVF